MARASSSEKVSSFIFKLGYWTLQQERGIDQMQLHLSLLAY